MQWRYCTWAKSARNLIIFCRCVESEALGPRSLTKLGRLLRNTMQPRINIRIRRTTDASTVAQHRSLVDCSVRHTASRVINTENGRHCLYTRSIETQTSCSQTSAIAMLSKLQLLFTGFAAFPAAIATGRCKCV